MSSCHRELLNECYRYALSLSGTKPEAEDLVQEAYYRCLKKNAVIKKGLMIRCIRNVFIDQYRHAKLISVSSDYDMNTLVSEDLDLDIQIDASLVEAELLCLRAIEREVLFLSAYMGYSAREISVITNHTRGTVLSLIHRAKQKLKAALLNTLDRKVS